jgi:predicted HAD superfamily Cof-like phosphohydrolase
MKRQLDQVAIWHDKFLCFNGTHPTTKVPTSAEMRHRIMAEENNEYLAAAQRGDCAGVLDALGDQLFVLLGTILTHGMQDVIEEAFDRITASNMTKLGDDGLPYVRPDGKILKGPNFVPPVLEDLVNG